MQVISEINHWEAEHLDALCGGPASLILDGKELLRDFQCFLDGVSDREMAVVNPKVYHKGGLSLFESDGQFQTGATHALRQINRYAANAVRITWDLNWVRGTAVKSSVQLGAGLLPGTWKQVKVYGRDGSVSTEALTVGFEKQWSPVPLAFVFEREDGAAFQFSPGFDLWRWDRGTQMVQPPEEPGERLIDVPGADAEEDFLPPPPVQCPAVFFVKVTAEGVSFGADVARPIGENTILLGGDYRFTAVLAWMSPSLRTEEKSFSDFVDLEYKAYLEGVRLPKEGRNFILDFSKLPVCDSGKTTDGTALCWESNKSMKAARKCIRQLQSAFEGGTLLLRGMAPHLCSEGNHCEKRGATAHWDLATILSFVAWVKNALGENWTICYDDCDVLAELPALQGLHLPNGFQYE